MATVYKIEIEVCSHWISYSDETIKMAVQRGLDRIKKEEKENKPSNELDAEIIQVKRIA